PMSAPFPFTLPPDLAAVEPPEHRGTARDHVRLMVIDRTTYQVTHTQFAQLGACLQPGDVLVLNTSRTLPAALHGCRAAGGACLECRWADCRPYPPWPPCLFDRRGEPCPWGLRPGMQLAFGAGLRPPVTARNPPTPRLWQLRFSAAGPALIDLLYRL